MHEIWFVLLSLSVISAGFLLTPSQERLIPDQSGNRTLVYSLKWKIFAIIFSFIIPPIDLFIAYKYPPRQGFITSLVIILFSMVTGIILLLNVLKSQVIISEDGIMKISPWHSVRSMKWGEIIKVDCPMRPYSFIFRSKIGSPIRVGVYMIGIADLIDEFTKRLSTSSYELAHRAISAASGKIDIFGIYSGK